MSGGASPRNSPSSPSSTTPAISSPSTTSSAYARAQENEILCQGRGSAANSAVCYCLGITSVNPDNSQLLFARFISENRGEPPDIDVDFEHERREEVIQYIYNRYGRDKRGDLRHRHPLSLRAAPSARSARRWG